MHLKIVTVDKTIVDADIKSLIARSPVGEFQILPGHTPLITLAVPSDTVYTTMDGKDQKLFTSGGIVKVLRDNILFITDAAELPEDIDLERARRALTEASDKLKNASQADRPFLKDAIARAEVRIKVKRDVIGTHHEI